MMYHYFLHDCNFYQYFWITDVNFLWNNQLSFHLQAGEHLNLGMGSVSGN